MKSGLFASSEISTPVVLNVQSCALAAVSPTRAISTSTAYQILSLMISPFPSMDAPSIANILVSLDGEEIETGCELKGFALRRTYGNISIAFRRCGDFAD